MKKRGQVTTFVIIGILIITIGIGIYFTRDLILDEMRIKEIEVPEQAEGVKVYVQGCFDKILKEAVELLGRQGGFIEFPSDPINVGEFTNYLNLYQNNKVIFWYYKADNNVDFKQVPNIKSMENEISNYVNERLFNCLGEFNEFDGFTINKGRLKTQTDIQKNKIISKLTFPLKITKGNFQFDFKEFYGSLNAPLGELFEIAENVYEKEDKELFLEDKTLAIMNSYEEVPVTGETSDCVAPIWVSEDVKRNLKGILNQNLLFLKIKGTNYSLNKERAKFFEIDADINNKGVYGNFMFSEVWPFEISIYPEKDGLLKGQSVTESLGEMRGIAEAFVCLSTYEFLYNLKYPVLIILNKDDYTFQFATMVVIDRNKARINEDEFLTFENYDQRFCNDQSNFVVYTVDQNIQDLDNVSLKYKCINHVCDLGISNNGIWQGRVPFCINGEFIGEKGGYHFGKNIADTNQDGNAIVSLEKLKRMNLEVLVARGGSGELREGERVRIQLENEDKDFSKFVIYPDQKIIDLIPGNYKAKVLLISPHQGLKIDEKTVQNCVEVPKGVAGGLLGLTEKQCTSITIPSVNLDTVISGTSEFEFLISEENLMKNTMVFYAPYHGVINDITEISKLTEQQGRVPEFK